MLKRSLVATLALTALVWSESNDSYFENIASFPSKIVQTVKDLNRSLLQNKFNGNWHVRVIDGKDVREARAILDLDLDKMKLSGFDACNRMEGRLIRESEEYIHAEELNTTRMPCRESIHMWVREHLHQIMKEGFTIKEEEKYGIKGATIKSPTHELFLKKMGDE
ncbi:META domain-containing protein [Sulfurovum sp.]|jgi:heat shock protein HslJ|uniref:META domain-containing protein n=1 Tax=Sulfurovum sp. TaxID=1969726 RepID=UPI002A363362|nr:META domain-containing protein [Sulfurovum sp.]MDD2451746.1 META domain-containing protein [Sulfurovum sp.]MDD3500286.1 META domain-containing protein [Sulfurovum sp.]MDY0401965.1 META domain-containing protein [Sulfurovum sp.]